VEPLDGIGMLLLGLLGTGHCLGMCGPLVFAFPGRTGRMASHLWYHLGRAATYVVIGGVMGGVGGALAGLDGGAALGRLAGIQIGLSLAAGLFLLVFGLIRLGLLREPHWLAALSPERIPGFGGIMEGALRSDRPAAFAALGLVLGLLPCGLSYAAFSRALAAGGFAGGAFLAAAFAAGTLPGLLLLGTGASAFIRRYRRQSDLLSGAVMFLMAVDLVYDAITALL
jgi:sulfite exporter TauE/SafE